MKPTPILLCLAITAHAAPAAPRSKGASSAAPPAATAGPVTSTQLHALRWRAIGPANMGGRVADIAAPPADASTLYVALGTGGLFKTSNHGTTWKPIFDDQLVASIGAVAVAPSRPDVVWVGTGEGNSRNSSSWGNGVYRSTDAGTSFTHLGLVETHNIPRLVVHPTNPDAAYVCALGHLWGDSPERGVFKTVDGGKTWSHALKLDSRTGCVDLLLDPGDPETVFAAAYARRRTPWSYESGGPLAGIYRSRDGGASWTRLGGGLPASTGRIGLDAARSRPGTVFAVIESDEGGNPPPFDAASRSGGVFRSDDNGESWRRVSRLAPRGFYFSEIRVDPRDDQHLWVLGFDLHVSKDGGATWSRQGADRVHVDHHALWIDPANSRHLVLGGDGGVYASWDGGEAWDFIDNIAAGEFYNVAVDGGTPYRVCGGLQDNGTWCGPSATPYRASKDDDEGEGSGEFGITNQDWRFVSGGDGFHTAIDPTDADIVYAESQGGALSRLDLAGGRRERLQPEAREGQSEYRFNWNTPFVFSRHDPTVLYLGANVLFRLTGRGRTWQVVSPDLTTRDVAKIAVAGSTAENHCTIVTLAESPVDAKVLWVGTDDGNVQLTRDGGQSWVNVATALPKDARGLYVSRVEASHHQAGRVYVAVDGHRSDLFRPLLFTSDDFGATFRPIASDLPANGPVKVVREDPANPALLFCGTEFGAFLSLDRGAHWLRLGEGMPTVAVDDLVIHPRDRDLVAGTHGRSVFVLDDITALEQATPEVVAKPHHLFQPRPARGFYPLPYGGIWGDRFFTAANPPLGATLNYWVKEYSTEPVAFEISDAAGRQVRALKGPTAPGLNRVVWDLQPEKEEQVTGGGLSQPALVPAGEYAVTMKIAGREVGKVSLAVTMAREVGGSTLTP